MKTTRIGKRIVGMTLVAMLLLAMMPMSSLASSPRGTYIPDEDGNFVWVDDYEASDAEFLIDEDFIMRNYRGPGGEVVIPDGVKGTGSGIGVFGWSSNDPEEIRGDIIVADEITSLILPASVENIWYPGLDSLLNLQSVTILNGDTQFENRHSTVQLRGSDATIYGVPGGLVELYAKRYGINFVAIGDPVPIPDEMAGADDWAAMELRAALISDLVLDDMIGNWTMPTNRLLAAEAIVKLALPSWWEGSIDEYAEQLGFDMTAGFADTDSKAATFLKAAGISTGVGDNNYGVDGVFTRIQMVTMLGRMMESIYNVDLSAYPLGSDTFTDIPDWPGTDAAVGWAVATGVTDGVGNGLFDSFGTLQNQHTGVFAYRAYAYLEAR